MISLEELKEALKNLLEQVEPIDPEKLDWDLAQKRSEYAIDKAKGVLAKAGDFEV